MLLYGVLGVFLAAISLGLGYLYILVLASLLRPPSPRPAGAAHSFAVAIPAHDEEAVIGATVDGLLALDYPRDRFDVYVVSDNSTDQTAQVARAHGAVCWERLDETRRSKGYALAWLFERIDAEGCGHDALVVFDADSAVDRGFLRAMDGELARGARVLQGRHVIANPDANWYTAAMTTSFALDNLRNQGRSNLGLSAKLMGDGMCFARDVLERLPWTATGLTEDAEYQARLLLEGIRVRFVPGAVSRGEMPTSLAVARTQWSRWMRGRSDVSRRLAGRLLRSGLRRGNLAQLDGAVEQVLPSLSTFFTVWGAVALAAGLLDLALAGFSAPWGWLLGLGAALGLYPVLGLVLSRAPGRVFLYLALAPAYALWRSALRLWVRFSRGSQEWVRTARSGGMDRRMR
ncbi:MAG: glycosyltransferase [Anaerolineae bacterium]|nr:glycosyltransferase [Anaerolineae bacterium]